MAGERVSLQYTAACRPGSLRCVPVLCVHTHPDQAERFVRLSHREQLPTPAPVHSSEALLLPGLQRDPRPAPHHVQEALLPLDL